MPHHHLIQTRLITMSSQPNSFEVVLFCGCCHCICSCCCCRCVVVVDVIFVVILNVDVVV